MIHPDQVPVVQAAFSPSPKQLEWARGLTVAFHEHQASGKVCGLKKWTAGLASVLHASSNTADPP